MACSGTALPFAFEVLINNGHKKRNTAMFRMPGTLQKLHLFLYCVILHISVGFN
jgi:hypothetical protein